MPEAIPDLPGATPLADGSTFFKVWAPKRQRVDVELGERREALTKSDGGWFLASVPDAGAGDRYRFVLDGELSRPDPQSHFQPEGVHGPSEIIDHSRYQWSDEHWQGVGNEDLVIYEIHVGTFTPQGTYRSAIDRLDELIELGITALEIMPLAQCPGRWNWGYDGVNLFAPAHPYGHPDDFKALVDACHQRGIAVILDVVYNHLGPEGNYLADFGPYHSRKHHTPWGPGLNFDSRQSGPVREFVLGNMRYWIENFHLDGLRVDAIRSMRDETMRPIIDDMGSVITDLQSTTERPLHLIAESNIHYPEAIAAGFTANWNDEIPHAILSLLLDQNDIANRDYHGAGDVEKCLRNGYVFRHRGDDHAEIRDEAGPAAVFSEMVQGLQTHDQVGNHPLGHRLATAVSAEAQRAAAALILLHPATPFLFMGEEFSESPFCFFVDYGDAHLQRAVVAGRKRDYAHHDWADFISPMSEEAFSRSKLPAQADGDTGMLKWYRDLLSLRREWLDSGILKQENLRVTHQPQQQSFLLDYGKFWVAARLGTREQQASDRTSFPLDGKVLLHSRGDAESPGDLRINEAALGVH